MKINRKKKLFLKIIHNGPSSSDGGVVYRFGTLIIYILGLLLFCLILTTLMCITV